MVGKETFASEALNPVKYMKADLKFTAQGCTDLTTEQQSKLVIVLREHETISLSKHGNWKGHPVTFEITEDRTPIWAKPYQVPLKNHTVFKKEVY